MEPRLLHRISELLDTLERTASEPGELADTLQHIAETAQRFFRANSSAVYAINPVTGRFVESSKVAGDAVENRSQLKHPRPEGTTHKVLQQGVLVIDSLTESPQHHNPFTQTNGVQAFVGLALYTTYTRKPLGVLYLNFHQPQHFGQDDRDLFQIFAEQSSYILQETWLVRRYREIARIGYEINQELSTVEDLFHKVRQHLEGILDISYSFLLALYLSPTNLLNIHMHEEGETLIRKGVEPTGGTRYVLEMQKTFFSQHMSSEEAILPWKRTIIPRTGDRESVIFVPLILRGVPLGVLSIQHPDPYAYQKEDRSILELLGNHIALALYNIRLYDSLRSLNETGQFLTQQIDSAQVLQETVEKIWRATEADNVILYPYDSTLVHFILPPRVAGDLQDATPLHATLLRPHDIAMQTVGLIKPIFAKRAPDIYSTLPGTLQDNRTNFQQREGVQSVAILPLRVGEVSVGVLFLNFRQPQHFDTPQKSLIEGLAHYAAIAIKNAQTFGALSQRHIHELEILQRIDRELSRTLDLNSVLETILRLGHEHIPSEEASILLHDPYSRQLETVAAIGRHAESSRTQVISLHETKGITRWVLEHKKPVRAAHVHREAPWSDLYFPVADDIVSELDVPLLDGDDVVGVLNFESTREEAFSEDQELFLVTLAGQAVLAIKKAQAYEREKRFAEEGAILNQISKEINSQLSPDHIFGMILEKALEATRSTTGVLVIYDRERNELWMAAEQGVTDSQKENRRIPLDRGVVGYVATTKRPLNIDPSLPPWNSIYLDYIPGTRSNLAVPMLAGDELRGVLDVESPQPNNFKEGDLRLLQALADLAVVALHNAQAFENEKRSATESQALNEISQEIVSKVDPLHIYELILRKALELTGSSIGSLHIFDPDVGDLRMEAEVGVDEEKRGRRQRLGEGIVGYAAEQRNLYNVADVCAPPWHGIYIEFSPGVRSELAVPMLEGNELRGVLNVESRESGHFQKSHEHLLRGLADLAVVALQSTERYRRASREAQHFEMLYEAGRELANITAWEQRQQAYDIILHIAERHSPCQVVLRAYDEATRELVLVCATNYQSVPPFPRIKLEEGLNGQAARQRHLLVVYDTHLPPSGVSLKVSDPSTRSLLVIPVQFKDHYYGNLSLGHREVGYFHGSEINFFQGLADQLASTIYRLETVKARQEFEQISSIGHSTFELTHRLANDLALVQFYTSDVQWQLEQLGITDEFISEKLHDIVQSVRGVLTFSDRLKRELVTPAEEELVLVAARELFEEAVSPSSLPPNIRLSLTVQPDVGRVRVVQSQVTDILRNLVANAVEAMPQSGALALQARNSGRYVAFEVTDDGVGIPPQHLQKIFDLSFSTKGSSGFGLWSARRNALRNRGDLRVESEPGRTTFTLLLPRTDGGTV